MRHKSIIILIVLLILSTLIGVNKSFQLRETQVLIYSDFISVNYQVGKAIETHNVDMLYHLKDDITFYITVLDAKIDPKLYEYMMLLKRLLNRISTEQISIRELNQMNFSKELYNLEIEYLSTKGYPKIKTSDNIVELIDYLKMTNED